MASTDGQQQFHQRDEQYRQEQPSGSDTPYGKAGTAADEAGTEIVPFLWQLSGEADSGGVVFPNGTASAAGVAVGTVAAAAMGARGGGGVGGAENNPGVDPDGAGGAGVGGDGRERDLDTRRQTLLTMLLAQACFEHDSTPRTFVEQVLRLYEAKVLDSIQFLFDMGFVPRVPLSVRNPVNRAAIAEAVRRQIDKAGASDSLLLSAWPIGATAAVAAAAAATAVPARRDGGAVSAGSGVDDENRAAATALGLRVVSTSRYWRDFEEEELIARGSFGDVYRTRHRLDGKRYAIKKVVFRGIGVSHPHARAVMREVQCLAQLDHKNIVRYHTSWLESGWIENGMRHYCKHAAPEVRARTDGARDVGPLGPAMAVNALTAASDGAATTDERYPANAETWLGSLENALIPVHLQPHFSVERKPRSGSVASESNSGIDWVFEKGKKGVFGDCRDGNAKVPRAERLHGNGPWGGSFAHWKRGGEGNHFHASATTQMLSPEGLILQPDARDRGLSHWTAEEAESDTSRWSELSSGAGGVWENTTEAGKPGGAALPACGGGDFGARPQRYSRRRTPLGVQKLREEQFRHPSIDMDDLVSFGTSSPTGDGDTVERGVEDFDEETSGGGEGGWREWDAASQSSSEALGGSVRGCRHGGERGHWGEQSVSPDGLVQYPVTLYIQMNLCAGDTLQDWLVKRNARVASEAETIAGSGVLFEENASDSRDSRGSRSPRDPETAADERLACLGGGDDDDDNSGPAVQAVCIGTLPHPIPVLTRPPLLAKNMGTAVSKSQGTPSSSPRTDPVTSASSDETSERYSNDGSSDYEDGEGDEFVLEGGTLCPPPSRELVGEILDGDGSGGAKEQQLQQQEGFDAASDACGEAKSSRSSLSPARSSSSDGSIICEGRGRPGRVDLHEALRMFRQVVEGVAHIHSKGIIHRDIKPENVFVGEDDCLKIGDFGLSRTEDATTMADGDTSAAAAAVDPHDDAVSDEAAIVPRLPRHEGHTSGVGTASYASPEQFEGRRYGVRSDLFSLGLILLELCCCFATLHERADVFRAMRHPDGAAPAHLRARSPFLADLAELLCRTDPELRPSAAEFLERLDALDGRCGCRGCPGNGGNCASGGGGGSSGDGSRVREIGEPGDVRLRRELAEKTRKVEEQEALIGQLQRKLTELSRNSSPTVGPMEPASHVVDMDALDAEALGLGLASAKISNGFDNSGTIDGRVAATAAESVP